MKVFNSFFIVCLGVLAFCNACPAVADTVTRGGAHRDYGTVSQTSRIESSTPTTDTVSARTGTKAATVRSPIKITPTKNDTRTNVTTTGRAVASRPTNTFRTATPVRPTAQRATRAAQQSARTPTTRGTVRVATVNESGALVTNYKQCREIYYECMDEFCVAKDANLRRCACSSRYNEFNSIKQQMSNIEDKMLDFNQRLLMVSMDPDDAKVVNVATEGEDAFYATRDNTNSKRALDDIAKKLNAKFGETDSGSGLSPVSWSLNIDTAFDVVDSFGGIDTTSKIGPALYSAAIPICREIATEVCDKEELELAISGYQMMIEQDCNTVRKSYQTQADAARTKVFESSALLDMSRLDTYQQKNSDDILTCKRKMLDMLTNPTVCGENLERCLDMTGRYIDPTTGAAFLTLNLSDIDGLITRPTTNQTWTNANSGSAFITYLNNRKKYLEPAMTNCIDISDSVWDAFIEDALAQIKLAQLSKLEEIRRACTTLTSECLTNATESINNFDTRALSIFGVAANRTANALCSDVKKSCAALIDSDGISSWESAISEITTMQTYDTILSSCTQVGRACIIQACKSVSGNFELCDDIEFSANRHSILERTACWSEVMECVGAAGDDKLIDIITTLGKKNTGHSYSFYDDLYGKLNISPIYDLCSGDCNSALTSECAKCRISERIWGNCETTPNATIPDTPEHNRILMPTQTGMSTLMSWFAINTGTANTDGKTSFDRSCINTRCTAGNTATDANGKQICLSDDAKNDVTSDGMYCPSDVGTKMGIQSGIQNCCFNPGNAFGHSYMQNNACCATGHFDSNKNICLPKNEDYFKVTLKSNLGTTRIVCIGDSSTTMTDAGGDYPGGQTFTCNGRFIVITDNNQYTAPSSGSSTVSSGTKYKPKMYYYPGTPLSPTYATHPAQQAWFIDYDIN